MIYIFYHFNSNNRIIIFALSYLEAKEVLYSFNPYADKIYNIKEFRLYDIDLDKFYNDLDIEIESQGYPRILSETEFSKIENDIINKNYADTNNIHVVCKNTNNENDIYKNLFSLDEFVNTLKENAKNINLVKRTIYKMLSNIGDIWVKQFIVYNKDSNKNEYYKSYGKSRYQCDQIIKDIKENNIKIYNDETPKLLIENEKEINNKDISNYSDMVSYIIEHKIKKFPFTTYENPI